MGFYCRCDIGVKMSLTFRKGSEVSQAFLCLRLARTSGSSYLLREFLSTNSDVFHSPYVPKYRPPQKAGADVMPLLKISMNRVQTI